MNERHRPVWYAVLAIALGVLVIMLVWTQVSIYDLADKIRSGQVESTGARKSSQQTLDAILDCSTPGGKCYQRGQAQYAKAVGDVNRVVVLASACSVGIDPDLSVSQRQSIITNCVITRLSTQVSKP